MSLTNFTGNTNVISGLPDEPSLTSEQLKAKFDEAGTSIKTFINGTLEPEIEQLIAGEKTTLQGLITSLGNQLRNELLEDNKKRYYVGRIIMDTENINPATYLGFGVWELWGKGKVPVGVDAEDEDFDEVEKTGGSKTSELRALIGSIDSSIDSIGYCAASAVDGNYKYTYGFHGHDAQSQIPTSRINHSTIVKEYDGKNPSRMQPYITCYMWKRVS